MLQAGEPVQPIGGARSPYGWVYGLFEIAIIVLPIALLTSPWWARRLYDWLYRPFGSTPEQQEAENGSDR